MSQRILFLILFSWLTTAVFPTFAQQQSDTTYTFRFVPRKDMFYGPWNANDQELIRLFKYIEKYEPDIMAGQVPLYIDGYCNSLNNEAENLATAKIRSNRVKSEMIIRKGLHESNFITHNHATAGDLVTVRFILPKESLSLIENKQIGCKKDTLQLQSESSKGTNEGKYPEPTKVSTKENRPHKSTLSPSPKSLDFSLRTNLLRWLTLTPDIGIGWRISRDWSILVNGTWTSWNWDNKNRKYALWEISPEVHYHIGKEKRGYLGIMYHIGEFNYKLSHTGKQGNLMGGGLTGGYVLPLGRHFSLDFSIGAGCTHAEFDKYHVINGVRVKKDKENKNYWGVNRLGISLIWNAF